jgi:hypothetical protein
MKETSFAQSVGIREIRESWPAPSAGTTFRIMGAINPEDDPETKRY